MSLPVRIAARYRRVETAFQVMRNRGLGALVDVLREAYATQDFIIEDVGEYELDPEGETVRFSPKW